MLLEGGLVTWEQSDMASCSHRWWNMFIVIKVRIQKKQGYIYIYMQLSNQLNYNTITFISKDAIWNS